MLNKDFERQILDGCKGEPVADTLYGTTHKNPARMAPSSRAMHDPFLQQFVVTARRDKEQHLDEVSWRENRSRTTVRQVLHPCPGGLPVYLGLASIRPDHPVNELVRVVLRGGQVSLISFVLFYLDLIREAACVVGMYEIYIINESEPIEPTLYELAGTTTGKSV